MKMSVAAAFGLSLGLVICGCGSDDAKSGSPPTTGDGGAASMIGTGGEPAVTPGDVCHEGCLSTLAAACSNGPADQATCESDCRDLEAGKCGAEYATFQTCAKGKAITCSAQGLPSVAACSDEQTAFVACLNG